LANKGLKQKYDKQEKEQGAVLCSFLKREIVILTQAKKGRYKVNEFKRETGSKKICGDGGIGSSEEFKFK